MQKIFEIIRIVFTRMMTFCLGLYRISIIPHRWDNVDFKGEEEITIIGSNNFYES